MNDTSQLNLLIQAVQECTAVLRHINAEEQQANQLGEAPAKSEPAETNPNKVTLRDIEDEIAMEYAFSMDQALSFMGAPLVEGLDRVIVVLLVMNNGFKAMGVNYGSVDPANYDQELGYKLARKNALDKIYPVLGYQLMEDLYQDKCLQEFTSAMQEEKLTAV